MRPSKRNFIFMRPSASKRLPISDLNVRVSAGVEARLREVGTQDSVKVANFVFKQCNNSDFFPVFTLVPSHPTAVTSDVAILFSSRNLLMLFSMLRAVPDFVVTRPIYFDPGS